MRKGDAEFGDKISAFKLWVSKVTETGKQPTCRIARRYRDVTVRADRRRRPFARKKLLAMTTQTTRVLRKIRDVGEGRVAFANILPVLRGNRMT